jgi:hypothetical protein
MTPRERIEEKRRNFLMGRKRTLQKVNGFDHPLDEARWYNIQRKKEEELEKIRQTKNYISS